MIIEEKRNLIAKRENYNIIKSKRTANMKNLRNKMKETNKISGFNVLLQKFIKIYLCFVINKN
jgi:hypothetical protein